MEKKLILILFYLLLNSSVAHAISQDSLERQAKKGQVSAMLQLGINYYFGINVKKDYSQAYKYFSAITEKSDASSYYLGVMTLYGQGTTKDPVKAVSYLEKASNSGDSEAKGLLGVCYKRGDGVNKDYRKAFINLSSAVSSGKKSYLIELGELYETGNGTNKNVDKALSLFLLGKNEGINGADAHVLEVSRINMLRSWINPLFKTLNKMSFFDLVGLISLISGYIFYKRSKKEKIPCYNYQTVSLISESKNRFKGLEVLYKGQQVESLSISRIAFWNAGNDIINKDDTALNSPVEIDFNGGLVLDAEVVYTNNVASGFNYEFSDDKQKLILKYDYIDGDDGAVYQVLHTSPTAEQKLTVNGKIKGARNISQQVFLESVKTKTWMTLGTLCASVVLGFMSYSVGADLVKMESVSTFGIIFCLVLGVLAVIFLLLLVSILTKKSMKGFDIKPGEPLGSGLPF